MTASGLNATDGYAPGTAMTAARDRARGVAAERREALIARDRFTLDPQDRRDAGSRRVDRPAPSPASGDAARTAKSVQAEPTADKAGTGVRSANSDAGASPARDAKPGAAVAGWRAEHTPTAQGAPGGAGSAQAAKAQAGAQPADGAKDSATDIVKPTAGSSPDASADPRGATTAVPVESGTALQVVPVQAAATQALPVAPAQGSAGAEPTLEGRGASGQAAASAAGALGAADARASEAGRIDGEAKRDAADVGVADGTTFAGVLAQAAGDTAPVAPPPDPSAAPAKAEAAAPTREAPPPASPLPATPPLPLGAVPMTIGLRALKGSSQFEIRLDPVELGRIDVTLDIDRDSGGASARLVVDRPETLALLQRDADSLQQALAQAGFDPGAAGITLSLRGDGTDGGGREAGAGGRGGTSPTGGGGGDADAAAPIHGDVRALRRLGGLDIRI